MSWQEYVQRALLPPHVLPSTEDLSLPPDIHPWQFSHTAAGTARHLYSPEDLLLLFSLSSSGAPPLAADSTGGCLLSSHTHPQPMPHQSPRVSQGAPWDQEELQSCAALLQQSHLCPASGWF